ncbi:MAG TPA: hypothetical protein DDY91_14000 [Planctomycetaceae bacterium]|nr:hypothetical protein [Planctomycetaceae bacterium]
MPGPVWEGNAVVAERVRTAQIDAEGRTAGTSTRGRARRVPKCRFLFDMNDYIGYSGILTKLWKSGNLDGIQVIGFRRSGCGWREATGIV